jgi:hypothetical protein
MVAGITRIQSLHNFLLIQVLIWSLEVIFPKKITILQIYQLILQCRQLYYDNDNDNNNSNNNNLNNNTNNNNNNTQ